ncbi:MAG: phosphotyrosine protein phosphatase, partial [Pseudobutyrivibrio sp.]|nr:phosphotyrosine protein phosphatase [Pseudobutyrivibrio sp.]
MNKINKVIFVAASGTARAPMAAAIFTNFSLSRNIIGESRGLVVQFPEPINQKVEAPKLVKDVDYTNYEEGIYVG